MESDKNLDTKQIFDVLLLDAETRQALVALRSLGKKGLRIALLGNCKKAVPAFSSKWGACNVVSPAEEGSEKYMHFLFTFLKKNSTAVIIPFSDGTIEIIRKYRRKLEKITRIALAS